MPKVIAFPRIEPRWVFDRDSVSFFALADNHVLRCVVSSEALYSHFGAQDFTEREMVRAFKENREAIEVVARKKIEEGTYQSTGDVLLRTDDFGAPVGTTTTSGPNAGSRGFTPVYKKGILDAPAALKVAREATAILREEMAVGSEPVAIVWDIFQMPEQPLVSLVIQDTLNQVEVNGLYTIADLAKPMNARFALFRLWDDLLSARIDKHNKAYDELVATREGSK